jgi:hypothetical protein
MTTPAFWSSYAALWLVSLFTLVLAVSILRQVGTVYLGTAASTARDGLAKGSPAPDIDGLTPSGEHVSWRPQEGRRALIVFGAVGCGACARLLPELRTLSIELLNLPIYYLVAGPLPAVAEIAASLGPLDSSLAVVAVEEKVPQAFKVRVSPFAFAIDEGGRIAGKGLATSKVQLAKLSGFTEAV